MKKMYLLNKIKEKISSSLAQYKKFEGFISIILIYNVYPIIRKFVEEYFLNLWHNILSDNAFNNLLNFSSFIIFLICILFFIIINSFISVICKEVRKFFADALTSHEHPQKNISAILNEFNYTLISMENIEKWAIDNNLYNKIPDSLWEKYRIAKDDCILKNYYVSFNLEILNKRNSQYNELVKIRKEIIILLIENK